MTEENPFGAEEAEHDALDGETCRLDEDVESDEAAVSLLGATAVSKSDADAERVQADITNQVPGWRGVRSCNSNERAQDAARPVAQQWANATIAANPDREVLNIAFYGRWRYRNETTGSGRRKCKGEWTQCIVYVDFAN